MLLLGDRNLTRSDIDRQTFFNLGEGLLLLMGGYIYLSVNYEIYYFSHFQALDVMKFKVSKF